jgi:GNAT superfamily N-acetyltransferase
LRPPPPAVAEPAAVLDIYLRDMPVHPYGIADVVQLWDRSRWWRQGTAVVGLMDLPGSDLPVLYAVAASAPSETLELLAALAPWLPDRFMATGPRGMAATLAPELTPRFATEYVKMHLAEPARLPAADPQVRVLDRGDLRALEGLYALDPVAGDFFWPGLLDSGLYVGRWADGDLVATGGIHVIEPGHSVAAIGNVTTHPAHRRQGLGTAVTATLARLLLDRVSTVGLNVREANGGARRLYESIGFATVVDYEEAELHRR